MTSATLIPPSVSPGATAAALLSAFPAAMAVVGLDLRFHYANPAMTRLLGARVHPGGALAEAVDAEDADALRERLHAIAQAQVESATLTLRWRRDDGGVFEGELQAAPVRDPAGRPEALLLQVRLLDDAHAALEAARRQLQLFTGAVSHDLRAPLRAIESFAARLDERYGDALDDTGRDHLARIRAAAARMIGLLAGLGDYVRAGRAELRPEPVDLSLQAEWACMALRERHPQRESRIDVAPGLIAYGDERLLRLMLEQLLDNAWRFARADAPVCVKVSGERIGDRLRLAIRDEGIGFDMRFAHKLFAPFQRLHGPEQGSGHGLGLAIAHRVVERHGGRIRAESAPEAGTTLYVDLPAEPGAMDATR